MKTMKKILALFLVLVMAGSIFAGCGNTVERADENLGTELTWEEKFGGETVELIWCFPDARGAADFSEWDRIVEAINKITIEKINTKIKIEVIPLGEYTEKMSLKYNANERWDVCFSGTQWNSYTNSVSQGVFEPLTQDYMKTYMPNVMANTDPKYLEALSIDGQIYGVPLQQIYVRQNGIKFEIDWAEEIGFDYTTVTKYEDLEPYFEMMKNNDPAYDECFLGAGEGLMENTMSYMGFDFLITSVLPGVVRVDDETCTVINQYETEEFKYIASLMEKWYKAGYFTDAAYSGGQDNWNFDEDRNPVGLEPVVKPGGDAISTMKLANVNGATVKTVPVGEPAVLTTSAIMQTTMAVSANCPYPGRALAFIDLLNSDAELLNLICYGEEGIDWDWVDKDQKLIEIAFGAYPGNEPFLVGNTFLSYYVHESQLGAWEETQKINANAKASPLLGFTFNTDPVSNEISTIEGSINQYLDLILCGMCEGGYEAGIAELNRFLYDAGLQNILDEMQRQIDEWKANQ